jgi:hypothetical protein
VGSFPDYVRPSNCQFKGPRFGICLEVPIRGAPFLRARGCLKTTPIRSSARSLTTGFVWH